MSNFRPFDRETGFLLPPSLDDWLPERHLARFVARAEAADQAEVIDGMSIPDELARREQRLAKLAEACAKIEARAKERFEQERAEHRAKLAARQAQVEATGKKPGGRPPAPPVEGPQPKDQINLTDVDSRIMPVAGETAASWSDYPAAVGNHMTNTDSSVFMNLVPSISLRENERGMQNGAGWNPHYHQATDRYTSYSDKDFRLGLNAAQTTLGAIVELTGATLRK